MRAGFVLRLGLALAALAGAGLGIASAQEGAPAAEPPPTAPAAETRARPPAETGTEAPPEPREQEPPPDPGFLLPPIDPNDPLAQLQPLPDVRNRGTLMTRVGIGRLLSYTEEIARVAIAEERLARVQLISTREVLVTGIQPGRTRLYLWLGDGERLRYEVVVRWDLDLLTDALAELDPRISVDVSANGRSIVLRGEVDDKTTAQLARARAESLIDGIARGPGGARVLDWLRYPGAVFSVEEELGSLLREIDERIRVRRIQVGEEPNSAADTFVLEGRVRDINTLVRAIIMAERQLGGTGTQISAGFEDGRVAQRRYRGGFGSFGGFSDGARQGVSGALTGLGGFGGSDPRSSSLASQVARGLLLTSASGRVVSTLKVDRIAQIMVAVRVLEVDRIKTRRAGVNFQIEGDKISIGSFTVPGIGRGSVRQPSLTQQGGANLVAAFVDQTTAILAAFEFLQQENLARAVAEPNVLTLSGELASIQVGGEVPIPTTAANQAATFESFFFQDFGVRLDIRPTVTDDDVVLMEVAPSIIRPTSGNQGAVPSFTVQSVTTTARVPAGESLLLGGLLTFDEGLGDARVPGLGWLPFFRSRRRTLSERELIFLITPRLVEFEPRRPAAPATIDPRPELDEIELPPLHDPRFRGRWRDATPAPELPPDGIPPVFLRDVDGSAASSSAGEPTVVGIWDRDPDLDR